MEEVAAVRRAAVEAVGDVEPDRLRQRIRGRLESGSMAPGALTLLSARAADAPEATVESDPDDPVAERGAGVQLIYEGLRLTRVLSQDPPWERDSEDVPVPSADDASMTDGGDVTVPDGEVGDPSAVPVGEAGGAVDPGEATNAADIEADMSILVADVMVARGFYLLARTEAAGSAVETVRAFGRDQTVRRTSGDESLDRNLEVDVFELAVVAGTTAVGGRATAALREYVADLARTDGPGGAAAGDPLSVAERLFSETSVETLADHLGDESGDGVTTSADS